MAETPKKRGKISVKDTADVNQAAAVAAAAAELIPEEKPWSKMSAAEKKKKRKKMKLKSKQKKKKKNEKTLQLTKMVNTFKQ